MIGDIVYRQGNYIEMIVKERGTTRLIVCCDFHATRPQPIEVRSCRIEYQDEGTNKHQVVNKLEEALTAYHILTEQHSQAIKDRLFCLQLSDRVRRGWCIHCGGSENVIRALCAECRKLPRFQELLGDQ
jgi:hypothetical protein